MCTENFVKFGRVVFRYARVQTHGLTDTLITVLCTPPKSELNIYSTCYYFLKCLCFLQFSVLEKILCSIFIKSSVHPSVRTYVSPSAHKKFFQFRDVCVDLG